MYHIVGGIMALAETVFNAMKPKARNIRKQIKAKQVVPYVLELREEPGEVLITRLLEKEQIESEVKSALQEALYPVTEFQVTNIGCADNLLWFTIVP